LGCDPRTRTRHEVRRRGLEQLGDGLYVSQTAEKFDPAMFVETLRYCIHTLDVEFVVLDHVSFALERDGDRWLRQNALILDIQLAIQASRAHMLLVAHPRKVQPIRGQGRDDIVVQMSDLKGQSEIYQDLANFLSLYRPRTDNRESFIDEETGHHKAALIVGKCRDEDGTEGAIELIYDKGAGRYYEAAQRQMY
jgi:hypothetical protein